MRKRVSTICAIAALLTLTASLIRAEEEVSEPIYRFDPALSLDAPQQPEISAGPVAIEKNANETSVRLQSETPVAPYLGVESGPELSAEEVRLLPDAKGGNGVPDYKLEAGIGLLVEDKASVNLGYRFRDQPSLLNDRRSDPLTLSGDLRVSFDLKIPFD